jgi:hypothetical protein
MDFYIHEGSVLRLGVASPPPPNHHPHEQLELIVYDPDFQPCSLQDEQGFFFFNRSIHERHYPF